jgi:outer membrane biosynthesis protein TonB
MASQKEQELRAQLRQARERLDGLVENLRTVDCELDGLAEERHHYRLLNQVCSGLEELSELGASGLFWGDRVVVGEGDIQLRLARGRVDVFEKQLGEIEERRQAVVEDIERQAENTEVVEDYLFEAQQLEEQRKLEWIIEREVSDPPGRLAVMPWARGGDADDRFRKALAASLLLTLLLGLILPLVDLPLPEPWKATEVPERLTRLIREERALPPPPPVQERRKPEAKQPEPSEEPLVAEQEPAREQTTKPSAASKGILAFREKFSGLAENKAVARLGSQARVTREGEVARGRTERSMVATQAPGSSGGINLASLSRDVGGEGGQGIEGIQVARATSTIGGGTGPERPMGGGPSMSRTDEEIQIVFDRHKSALYRLYNRELRRDPTLKGQIVLRFVIEPDGSVSLCEIQSTDMKAPKLGAQVVARVKTFDFGAKEGVPSVSILYPIDFLPAT